MSHSLDDKYWQLDEMQAAMQGAVQAAIAEHHRHGRAVPIWRDGRVVWLGPGGVISETDPHRQHSTDTGQKPTSD